MRPVGLIIRLLELTKIIHMEAIWIIILAISTPVAGIVGFAIQLRNVKKVRLENEKLCLEIAELKRSKMESEKQIAVPTNDEVVKYALDSKHVMFRKSMGASDRNASGLDWGQAGLLIVVIFVLLYFLYDLYRFGSWVLSKF